MTLLDAAIYSLVGILVVFFALILLMAVIKILLVVTDEKPAKVAAAASSDAPAPVVPKQLAPGTAGDIKLYDTDPRDAAMIMAIVANQLQKPLNELRFISIKEVK